MQKYIAKYERLYIYLQAIIIWPVSFPTNKCAAKKIIIFIDKAFSAATGNSFFLICRYRKMVTLTSLFAIDKQ